MPNGTLQISIDPETEKKLEALAAKSGVNNKSAQIRVMTIRDYEKEFGRSEVIVRDEASNA